MEVDAITVTVNSFYAEHELSSDNFKRRTDIGVSATHSTEKKKIPL